MIAHRLVRTLGLGLLLGGCTASDGGAQDQATDAERASSMAVEAARAALDAGLPWRATRALAPLLADSARRTPEVELLAAGAAAEWEGWGEVRRVLAGAGWLDSAADGMGHALLAQAALAARDDAGAIRHARRAWELTAEGDGRTRGRRLVYLARALDRADSLAEAAVRYALAAEHLPELADWLWLRAAAVTPDSAALRRYLSGVANPAALARVPRTRAEGLLRAGDSVGAARAWRELGEVHRALVLELARAATRAESLAVREELMGLVRNRPGRPEAERAVALLDAAFGRHSAAEELLVARSAVRSGPVDRAIQAYERAIAAGVATSADRFRYAGLLERQNRYTEAATHYGRVESSSSLAPRAAYLRARSILRAGRLEPARTELRSILQRYPADTAAAISLVLLADLAIDEGRDADARAAYLRLASSFPRTWYGPFGRYQAGIIAYAAGDHAAAAQDFDAVHTQHPSSDDAIGALYWSGRAHAERGDSAGARDRWRRVLQAEPSSWYGFLAARRLGVPGWRPAGATAFPPTPADVRSGLARAAELERVGLVPEAQAEVNRVLASADSSMERQLATGHALVAAGMPWRSITLGWRAVGRGAPRDATTYALLYPVVRADALRALSAEHALDPALVAGLIRQESTFNPRATSVAGARGLMQVMPAVGERTARSLRYPLWDPALLYQPDVNLDLGTEHLREMTRRFPETVRVLAAYNAGASRVERWDRRAGMDDPELYAERIPYKETRDYVRIVQRNREVYRLVHPELCAPVTEGGPSPCDR